MVIGHRGMGPSLQHRDTEDPNPYRENTRTSFMVAHAMGATWVEMDVLPSADGDLMLHHDHFLTAFNDTRPVWEASTQELLDYGIEPLDGLCEVLPTGLGFYLEVKVAAGDVDASYGPGSTGSLVTWMQAHRGCRPMLAASFNPFLVADVHGLGVRSALLGEPGASFHALAAQAVRAGADVLVPQVGSLSGPAHEQDLAWSLVRDHDVEVWVWDVVPSEVIGLRAVGVNGFCVDDVHGTMAALL